MEYEHVATGAFCIYSGDDPATGRPLVLVVKRGSYFREAGTDGHGVPGGYIELPTRREQPREAAIREFREEILRPDGSPVLDTVTPDRLTLIDVGIDYKAGRAGTLHAGTAWQGYHCALTPAEWAVLGVHAQKMRTDSAYADEVRRASNQETADVLLVPAADVPDMVRSGVLSFAYPHEEKVLLAVAGSLVAPDGRNCQKAGFSDRNIVAPGEKKHRVGTN